MRLLTLVTRLAVAGFVVSITACTVTSRHRFGANEGGVSPRWEPQLSGTSASLRGVSAVSRLVAWASGSGGTCVRTVDGGASWQVIVVPGAETLDLRDSHAVDADTAYLLAAGRPAKIFKTNNGGRTWAEQYSNHTPGVFLNALAFWDADHGIAFGDPLDGSFLILTTADGGITWSRLSAENIPPPLPDEHGFAASGTCLNIEGTRNAWIGTGGSAARVLRSTDRGQTWTATTTPMTSGRPPCGVFSLAFRDADHGVAVGGDYERTDQAEGNAALSGDGGVSWTLVGRRGPRGYRSAVAYVPRAATPTLVAVGPSGSDYSVDAGRTWQPIGPVGYHSVSFAPDGAGWAVGEGGRIASFCRGATADE